MTTPTRGVVCFGIYKLVCSVVGYRVDLFVSVPVPAVVVSPCLLSYNLVLVKTSTYYTKHKVIHFIDAHIQLSPQLQYKGVLGDSLDKAPCICS